MNFKQKNTKHTRSKIHCRLLEYNPNPTLMAGGTYNDRHSELKKEILINTDYQQNFKYNNVLFKTNKQTNKQTY